MAIRNSEATGVPRGYATDAPAVAADRYERKCPQHRVTLVDRNGAPFCPWQAGHYPGKWVVVDREKPGQEIVAGAEDVSIRELEAWRAGVRNLPERRPAPPAPVKPPAAAPPSRDAEEEREMPTQRKVVARVERAADGRKLTRTRHCSKCGQEGHSVVTCGRPRPAPAPAPARRAPPPSAALALTGHTPDLEKLRDQLARDLQELNRALLTFDLIERRIPKRYVELARGLLVEAGVSKEATEGRQSIALAKLVAGVAAALFTASTPRLNRRKQEVLAAAAEAIASGRSR